MREMKNSGVEWIGEIPAEWELLPAKRLFSCVKRIVGKSVDDYERLALTMQGVIKRSKDDSEGLQPEKFEGYQILRKNELVFKLIDLENVKTSRVGISPYTGLVSPAYIVLSNNQENNRFAYYWFMFMYYNEIFNRLGGVGVRSALNAKDVLALPLPAIDSEEQTAIASYLDKKCSNIDAIITKNEQIIEKLKAYKSSLITEKVTKGLNPDVEMKDSGVEWIGKMPAEWKAIKLKYVIKIENGINPQTEGNIPVYGSGSESFKTCGEYKEGPAVLLGRKGTINIPRYIEGKYWNVDTVFSVTTISFMLKLKFFYYVSTCFDYSFYNLQTTLPSMTQTNYNNMFIPLPPLTEQITIAAYLDKKCSKIDANIKNRELIIQKLAKYKKSLIYEVVTGKKEII